MGGDLYYVFGGVGVGFFEEGDYGFVEGFSCGVKDFSEAGLRGGQGMAEFQEGFRDGAGAGAGETDYADAAPAGWGGDGDDGVFELSHGEVGHLGFLMVMGEKFIGVAEGVFCRGFC